MGPLAHASGAHFDARAVRGEYRAQPSGEPDVVVETVVDRRATPLAALPAAKGIGNARTAASAVYSSRAVGPRIQVRLGSIAKPASSADAGDHSIGCALLRAAERLQRQRVQHSGPRTFGRRDGPAASPPRTDQAAGLFQPSLTRSPAIREWYISLGFLRSHGFARCMVARLSQITTSPGAHRCSKVRGA